MQDANPAVKKEKCLLLAFAAPDRCCAWYADAHLFLCWKKSQGHQFHSERRVAAAAAELLLMLVCVKTAHLSPLKLVSVVGCDHAIGSLMTRGIVQKTKDL